MKKLLLTGALFCSFIIANAQKTADSVSKAIQKNAEAIGQGGNNELKLNLLYAIVGIPEITYERLLKDNMGIGLSVFVGIDDQQEYDFAAIPHFRVYFGGKKAAGFFVEANAAVVSSTVEVDYFFGSASSNYSGPPIKETNFGLGAAAGAKFLTRNGFTGEVYLGLGRIFGNDAIGGYPRSGITIGKRF